MGYLLARIFDREGEILSVAVDTQRRRGGVARALVTAAQESADVLLLEVREDNVAALALYEAAGFSHLERRVRYYGGEVDAIVLRWQRSAAAHSTR